MSYFKQAKSMIAFLLVFLMVVQSPSVSVISVYAQPESDGWSSLEQIQPEKSESIEVIFGEEEIEEIEEEKEISATPSQAEVASPSEGLLLQRRTMEKYDDLWGVSEKLSLYCP